MVTLHDSGRDSKRSHQICNHFLVSAELCFALSYCCLWERVWLSGGGTDRKTFIILICCSMVGFFYFSFLFTSFCFVIRGGLRFWMLLNWKIRCTSDILATRPPAHDPYSSFTNPQRKCLSLCNRFHCHAYNATNI